MKIKPPTPGPNPRALQRRRLVSPLPCCNPFQAWIQPTQLPQSSGDTGLPVTLQATIPQAAAEQLSSRVVQAVREVALSVHPHKVLVTFHSGWLQGVTCAVTVVGRSVRLRLRADGARQRVDLQQGRKILSGRLASAGFDLGGYEVSP